MQRVHACMLWLKIWISGCCPDCLGESRISKHLRRKALSLILFFHPMDWYMNGNKKQYQASLSERKVVNVVHYNRICFFYQSCAVSVFSL